MGYVILITIVLFAYGMFFYKLGYHSKTEPTAVHTEIHVNNVSTRFNPRDIVYWFHNGKVKKCSIKVVYTECRIDGFNERYLIVLENDSTEIVHKSELFETKEELVCYINNLSIFK